MKNCVSGDWQFARQFGRLRRRDSAEPCEYVGRENGLLACHQRVLDAQYGHRANDIVAKRPCCCFEAGEVTFGPEYGGLPEPPRRSGDPSATEKNRLGSGRSPDEPESLASDRWRAWPIAPNRRWRAPDRTEPSGEELTGFVRWYLRISAAVEEVWHSAILEGDLPGIRLLLPLLELALNVGQQALHACDVGFAVRHCDSVALRAALPEHFLRLTQLAFGVGDHILPVWRNRVRDALLEGLERAAEGIAAWRRHTQRCAPPDHSATRRRCGVRYVPRRRLAVRSSRLVVEAKSRSFLHTPPPSRATRGASTTDSGHRPAWDPERHRARLPRENCASSPLTNRMLWLTIVSAASSAGLCAGSPPQRPSAERSGSMLAR